MKLKPLNLQVVVVLGASSGIGRATVLKFAKAGSVVIAASRSKAGVDSLVEEVRSFGGEIQGVICDTTVTEDVKRLANTAVSAYGRVDTWVQNACKTFVECRADVCKLCLILDLLTNFQKRIFRELLTPTSLVWPELLG